MTASLAGTSCVPSTSRPSHGEPGSTATRPRSRSVDPRPPDSALDLRNHTPPATSATSNKSASAARSTPNGSESLEKREVWAGLLTGVLL